VKKIRWCYWVTGSNVGWRLGRCPAGIQLRAGRVIVWWWPFGDPLWKEAQEQDSPKPPAGGGLGKGIWQWSTHAKKSSGVNR
jgi:hypothetical protein